MTCAACGFENPADPLLCEECGAGIEAVCRSCATGNGPTARFCRKCSAPLAPAAADEVIASPARYNVIVSRQRRNPATPQ